MNVTKLPSGIYQAELRVPKDLQHVIGKKKFSKSLKTRDRRRAAIDAAPILAEWDRQLNLARQAPDDYAREVAELRARADYSHQAGDLKDHDHTAADLNLLGYTNWLDDLDLPAEQRKKYTHIAFGDGVPTPAFLKDFLDQYANKKTRGDAKRSVLEVTQYVPTLQSLTLANARKWLQAEERKPEGERRALATVQKVAGFVSEYIVWLQNQGLLHDSVGNPFKGLRYPKALKGTEGYVPLVLDEITALRNASIEREDNELTAYIDVARYTAMRISEVAALSSQSVEVIDGIKCFRVRGDAKTKASSNRLVPIAKSLERLMKASGYPLDSFDFQGRDDAVGKRFGRLKRDVLPDGASRTKVFHSIRKFVATTLEQAGVPETIAADLVGHEKQTMTYGVYSGGSALKQLAGAVKKLEAAQK